ncbi:MAG: hypothetical protein IIC76_14655 [Bacteroidetes bacterium]|nr:hypothetical protein [Bacteroidota bacterium]
MDNLVSISSLVKEYQRKMEKLERELKEKVNKYRNAIEALKEYMRQPERDIEALLHYARVDRVEKIMRPYIEAIA